MKTSEILISTFVAAAAMSVPAFAESKDLTWNSSDSEWTEETTWKNGDDTGATFADGDTVTFAAPGEGSAISTDISVSETKSAQAVNITGGSYSFSSAASGGSVSVTDKVTISDGASLTLNEGVFGSVANGISLEGAGATLTLSGAAISGLPSAVVSGSGKVVLTEGSLSEPSIATNNVLTGNISLEINTSKKITIKNAQSYTGGTTITKGNLGVSNGSALGTGTITLAGGQITAQTNNLSFANQVKVTENGGVIHTQGNTMTFNGSVSVDGTLTKDGSGSGGTLVLLGGASGKKLNIKTGTVQVGSSSQASALDFEEISISGTLYLNANVVASAQTWSNLTFTGGTFHLYDTPSTKSEILKVSNVVMNGNGTITSTWGGSCSSVLEVLSGSGDLKITNESSKGDSFGGWSIGKIDSGYSGTLSIVKDYTVPVVSIGSSTATSANLSIGASSKVNLTGTEAYSLGEVSVGSGASLSLGASEVVVKSLSGSGAVALLSGTSASKLKVDQASDTEFSGSLATGVTLEKAGAGTLTLSGQNTSFAGAAVISGGTLLAGNDYALGETGVGSSITVSGGQLQLGEGVSIMADNISVVLSDAYLNPSAAILAESAASNAAILGTVSATNDEKENIGNDTVTVTADLAALSGIFTSVGRYDFQIIDADTVNVTDGTLTLDSNLESAFGDRGWEWSFSNGVLTVNVPEPSSFGLLAGAGVLALAAARRRRPCRKS